MDSGSNCNDYYTNVLSDFAELKTSYVKATENLKQLEKFVGLLREELRISRDAERTAEFKKSCVQTYVGQQQEVINKLLSIKEEKETLNQSLKELQKTHNELVIKYKAEQEKRGSELEQMKKTHNVELLLIRERADEEVMNIKNNSEATLNALNMRCTELTSQIALIKSERENTNSTVQKFQENIKKLNEKVKALQAENAELKERSAANITIFQTKIAEQERQHLAELETWKRAEINRNPPPQNNSFKQSQFKPNIQLPTNYPPNSNSTNQQYVTNPMIYQHHIFYQPQNHKPPLNITTSKKTVTSFQSANEFYRQNKNPENNKSEKNMCEEETLPEVLKEHVNINGNISKPKFPASIKKRKLYNKDSDWAD